MEDLEQLRQFSESASGPAFAALVRRYIDLVHSSARRQVGDPHLADDVTQAVFCALARKAPSLITQGENPGHPAWLLIMTRWTAQRARRAESRRRHHERRAAEMSPAMNEPPHTSSDGAWQRIEPLPDDALAELGEADRRAVVLRFFERLSLSDEGKRLGVSEDAAKQRVWAADRETPRRPRRPP